MEPNPQFTINKTLRPCRVTKNLLLDLERNISATLTDIAGEGGNTQKQIKLSITDEDGEEVFTSAEQITGDQFQNSTKQIQLAMSALTSTTDENRPAVILTVRFYFRVSSCPTLRIIFQCPRARDQAVGLEGRVKRLMESSTDRSRFFHPPAPLLALIVIVSFVCILYWLAWTATWAWTRDWSKFTTDAYVFLSTGLAALLVYAVACPTYFPDCAFDTKRRRELDEQKAWAKKALWSLIGINLLVLTIGGVVLEKIRVYFGFGINRD